MNAYHTVGEKSLQWGVSSRYIQSLCRQGKINGAVKRAGSWFIPDTTELNGKIKAESDHYFRFSGTKRKIFEAAIELFGKSSYDLVSVKDIADSVGIRQSAVYNHFTSKQEMLDTIYAFYRHHYLCTRPTVEDLEPILRTGSLKELVNSIVYNFDPEVRGLMLSITKIILQRRFNDEQAENINRGIILEEGMRYCEAVFDRAVEIGRLAPFNTRLLSVFFNSTRQFVLWGLLTDFSEENLNRLLSDQDALIELATTHLVDLGKIPGD